MSTDLFAQATGLGTPLELEPRSCSERAGSGRSGGTLIPYYSAGGITIYHGDCREIVPMLGRFDLMMTDPPYGLRVAARGGAGAAGKNRKGTFKVDWQKGDWDDSPVKLWELEMSMAHATESIVWGGNYYPLPPCRGWLVWDKDNGENDFADCELAWVSWDAAVRRIKYLWHGMRQQNMKEKEPRLHPTMKPVAVMRWAIEKAPGEVLTVLDPYAGSGTTGRACKDLGKTCVLIEREERFCEASAKRMEQECFSFGGGGAELVAKDSCDSPKSPNESILMQ